MITHTNQLEERISFTLRKKVPEQTKDSRSFVFENKLWFPHHLCANHAEKVSNMGSITEYFTYVNGPRIWCCRVMQNCISTKLSLDHQ